MLKDEHGTTYRNEAHRDLRYLCGDLEDHSVLNDAIGVDRLWRRLDELLGDLEDSWDESDATLRARVAELEYELHVARFGDPSELGCQHGGRIGRCFVEGNGKGGIGIDGKVCNPCALSFSIHSVQGMEEKWKASQAEVERLRLNESCVLMTATDSDYANKAVVISGETACRVHEAVFNLRLEVERLRKKVGPRVLDPEEECLQCSGASCERGGFSREDWCLTCLELDRDAVMRLIEKALYPPPPQDQGHERAPSAAAGEGD